jgi:hypothetical protein
MVTINVLLTHPLTIKQYSFFAFGLVYNFIYFTTNQPVIQLFKGLPSPMKSLHLSSIPEASGAKSIYILQTPSMFIDLSLSIHFPYEYEL